MAHFRVYIKTFTNAGVYQSDFTDITKYVQSIGRISMDTDSSDYQIGIFRNANVKLKLTNRSGKFSDAGLPETMFPYKRTDSIVKITYLYEDDGPWLGACICGEEHLSEEVEVFRGLLSDDSFIENARDEFVEFNILGFDSLFDRVRVPFAALSNGMTVTNALFAILNQIEITSHLTVSLSNINPDLSQAIDDVSSFENKTVKEALNLLLNASNSVLYIENLTVHVDDRTAGSTSVFTFHGQASQTGIENLMDVSKITNGVGRMFNFAAWTDTSIAVADQNSVNLRGIRKKEVNYEFFTDTTKRSNILTAIVDEFADPKRELEVTVPLNYETLEMNLLDRTVINYPTILIPHENNPLPICGVAVCGSSTTVLPKGIWTLTLDNSVNWKIIRKDLGPDKQTMTFKLREI